MSPAHLRTVAGIASVVLLDEHIVKPARLFEYVGELAFAIGLARRHTA